MRHPLTPTASGTTGPATNITTAEAQLTQPAQLPASIDATNTYPVPNPVKQYNQCNHIVFLKMCIEFENTLTTIKWFKTIYRSYQTGLA